MVFNKLVRIRVGTDVSRPRWQSTAEKDVRHRSLQATYPDYFVKPHYRVRVLLISFVVSSIKRCRHVLVALSGMLRALPLFIMTY